MARVEIGNRSVGSGKPCFIIAEAGVSHNGSLELAIELVNGAAAAKADAIKFQTFRADDLATADAEKAKYQKVRTGAGETQREMLRRLELSPAAHGRLAQHCRSRSIMFLSTAFDPQSVDLLFRLKMPAFKIASGEITNWPLLRYIARLRKPIILSTGMSYLSEIDEAIRVLRCEGVNEIALLHCVSNYPADPASANLRAISTLKSAFRVPVGLSDHTLGLDVPIAAVAVGASIIEKHFTLDRTLAGPDHEASITAEELSDLISRIRRVEAALGNGCKEPLPSEEDVRRASRRSIVIREPIPPGTKIHSNMLTFKRPGTGISPVELELVVGRVTKRALAVDTLLRWEDLR